MRKTRWLVCLTLLLLLTCLMSATAFAAPATSITVNGVNILTAEDNTVSCGTGTAVYDESSNTLTLENATITTTEGSGISFSGGDLIIVLKGQNEITASAYGIWSNDGSLTMQGETDSTLAINSANWGIRVNATGCAADISGVTLNITVTGNYSGGIYAGGVLTVQDNASITATGANNGYGIWGYQGVSITDSKMNAQALGAEAYEGIRSESYITIINSKVEAKTESDLGDDSSAAIASNGNMSISGGNSVKAEGKGGNAVNVYGDLTVSGSGTLLEAETKAASGYPVVYAYGDISILSDAEFQSQESAGFGLYTPYNVIVTGGKLTIASSGNYAIRADNSLSVTENSTLDIGGAQGIVVYGTGTTTFNGVDGEINVQGTGIWSPYGSISFENCGLELSGIATVNAGYGTTYLREIQIKNSTLNITGGDPLYVYGDMTITDSTLTVNATKRPIVANYGILTIDGAKTDVQATGGQYISGNGVVIKDGNVNVSVTVAEDDTNTAMGAIYGYTDGITISGGTVNASIGGKASARKVALITGGDLNITGGIITLSGDYPIFISANGGGSLNFGNTEWYQWANNALETPAMSAEAQYTYVFSKNNYLRIEPIGTTYSLTVEGGEGSGLYTAGSEVKISAEPYNSQEHFTGWTVTGANADDVLTDSTAASTTITVPAGGVTVTANYAAHTLEEHATKAPTCTEVGWEAYESCACGYSTYKEIPATGHTPGTGWHSNDENHWHECTVCSSETDEAAHDYEWVTDKESTATEAGSKHEQCSVCGYAKAAVEIPATGTDKPSDEKPTGDSDEPDTGDNSNILMWAALMSVSAAGLAFMAAKHRKAVRENQ